MWRFIWNWCRKPCPAAPTLIAVPAKAGIHPGGDGVPDNWIPAFAGTAAFLLAAQNRADRDVDFARLDLGAVAEAQARDLDEAALGVDAQPLGAGRDDLAELLAAYGAERRRHDLLGVEQIKLLLLRL